MRKSSLEVLPIAEARSLRMRVWRDAGRVDTCHASFVVKPMKTWGVRELGSG